MLVTWSAYVLLVSVLTAAIPHQAERLLTSASPTAQAAMRVIELLNQLPESRPISDQELADHVGLTRRTIRRIRPQLADVYAWQRDSTGHAYAYCRRFDETVEGFAYIPAHEISRVYAEARTTATRRDVCRRYAYRVRPASCGRYGAALRWADRGRTSPSPYTRGRFPTRKVKPPGGVSTAQAERAAAAEVAARQNNPHATPIRYPNRLQRTIAACYLNQPHRPHPGICGPARMRADQTDNRQTGDPMSNRDEWQRGPGPRPNRQSYTPTRTSHPAYRQDQPKTHDPDHHIPQIHPDDLPEPLKRFAHHLNHRPR